MPYDQLKQAFAQKQANLDAVDSDNPSDAELEAFKKVALSQPTPTPTVNPAEIKSARDAEYELNKQRLAAQIQEDLKNKPTPAPFQQLKQVFAPKGMEQTEQEEQSPQDKVAQQLENEKLQEMIQANPELQKQIEAAKLQALKQRFEGAVPQVEEELNQQSDISKALKLGRPGLQDYLEQFKK